MAPGVLGMARTMRAPRPQAFVSEAMEVPAAMETISAPLPAMPRKVAASVLRSWGLMATTQARTCLGASARLA